jgi:hypothetical protein
MKSTKKKVVKKSTKTFDPKKLPNIKPTYTITLTYGDKSFTATSDDVTEAILGLRPDRINNRAVFTLSHNGDESSMMRTVTMAKRSITNRLTATMLGRYLLVRLAPTV